MLRTTVSSRAHFMHMCLPSLSACLLPKGGCPLASLSVLRSHSCALTLCAPPPSCLSLHFLSPTCLHDITVSPLWALSSCLLSPPMSARMFLHSSLSGHTSLPACYDDCL